LLLLLRLIQFSWLCALSFCCFQMSDATRSILHEVMEQQTVSIAKAGIVCTLNARTSILASANPKESRYNPKLSVVENVQIMPTLLSRFDLIYLVLDQPNEHKDRKLAKHLVSLYHAEPERAALETIPMHLLTAYISYARKHCRPTLSPEAEEKLIEFYTGMRQQGGGGNQKVITATPRQLEALIRLSEALAKMKLKDVVEEEEVHEAKRLMDVATQRVSAHSTHAAPTAAQKRTPVHVSFRSLTLALAFFASSGRDGPDDRSHRHGLVGDGPLVRRSCRRGAFGRFVARRAVRPAVEVHPHGQVVRGIQRRLGSERGTWTTSLHGTIQRVAARARGGPSRAHWTEGHGHATVKTSRGSLFLALSFFSSASLSFSPVLFFGSSRRALFPLLAVVIRIISHSLLLLSIFLLAV
jgi:hypothetical protein